MFTGVAAAVANVAFLAAIRLVGSTRMSIFDMLQRPLLIVAAALILKAQVSWMQMLGVAVLFVGVHFAKAQRTPALAQA